MARYIDAEKCRQIAIERTKHFADRLLVIGCIEDTPAEEVAPVVHARFKPYPENIFRNGQNMKCTNCGKLFKVEYLNYLFWDYCPNCGAIMDEEGDGENGD